MPNVSRRGLFALGGSGAAAAVLAACGESADPRENGDDDQLVAAEAEAEQRLAAAYGTAASSQRPGDERTALESFAKAAAARSNEFGGGSAQAGNVDGGPDSAEALSAAINLANDAIAAHRAAVTGIDAVDGRGLATSALVACAAELAAVSGFAGEPEVPRAFVTGGDAEPYVAASSDSTSTTSTSSTSTTSTEAE